MASNLTEFFNKGRRALKTDTIGVTLRDGRELEADIQELEPSVLKRLRSMNTKTYAPAEGSSVSQTALDELGFAVDVVIAGMTAPDLTNAGLMNSYGVYTKEDLVYSMFSLNEISLVATAILQLTSEDAKERAAVDGTDPELVKEAKNS